jgi:hypothetical protein
MPLTLFGTTDALRLLHRFWAPQRGMADCLKASRVRGPLTFAERRIPLSRD